ncbi:hypothetical protein FXO37_00415 [Capsicum annuum]|nr:hypothetical protein FXO37_00415 [Capsicum annuum]
MARPISFLMLAEKEGNEDKRELFVITRHGIFNNPRTITNSYGVKQFIVHKVDVDTEHYEKVDDLGNRSFFLGQISILSNGWSSKLTLEVGFGGFPAISNGFLSDGRQKRTGSGSW